MIFFDNKDVRIFTTNEFLEELNKSKKHDDMEETKEYFIELFHRLFEEFLEGQYREYIRRFAKINGLKGFAVLHIHGNYENGRWAYYDKDRMRPVQNWVRRQDGKFACIVCFLCNPGHLSARARHSLLLLPDRDIKGSDEFNISLIDPNEGEINDYTLAHYLRKLRKK
jgi:hypothetical protein